LVEDNKVESGFAQLARLHPTLVLTASYLALTTVGLIYNFWLFRSFGINVVDYSETSDFLLSAVRTPLVIMLSVVPVFILLAGQYLNKLWLKRFPSKKPGPGPWWNTDDPKVWAVLGTVFVIIYAIYFTELYARRVARDIRNGKGKHVTVELMGAPGAVTADPTLLLGTTGKFVFLYYPQRNQTRIIPVENISSITVARKQKQR